MNENNSNSSLHELKVANKKLTEELLAVTRNFDALVLKRAEDQNLIKRLRDELALLQSKCNNVFIDNKNDSKDDLIKTLEDKINSMKQQYNMLDKNYKQEMNLLRDNITKLKKDNKDLFMQVTKFQNGEDNQKKENDNKTKMLLEEIKKLKNELHKQKSIEKDLIRMNDLNVKAKDKVMKENKMMFSTLEETREKLSQCLLREEELKKTISKLNQLQRKTNSEIDIEDKLKEIQNLKEQVDILLQEKQFSELNTKNLMDEIKKLKNNKLMSFNNKLQVIKLISIRFLGKIKRRKTSSTTIIQSKPKLILQIQTTTNIEIVFIKKTNNNIIQSLSSINILIYKVKSTFTCSSFALNYLQEPRKCVVINNTDNYKQLFQNLNESLIDYVDSFEKKIISILSNKDKQIEHKILKITNMLNLNIPSFQNTITQLKKENKTLNILLKSQKKQIKDEYENKLIKKRDKIKLLKTKITSLENNIKELNKRPIIDMTTVNELFAQINSIVERLKLTFETIAINLQCKHCGHIVCDMHVMLCGHSMCLKCIELNWKCDECGKMISNSKDNNIKRAYINNIMVDNLIKRYKYAQQQINSDLDLMVKTIKNYLKL